MKYLKTFEDIETGGGPSEYRDIDRGSIKKNLKKADYDNIFEILSGLDISKVEVKYYEWKYINSDDPKSGKIYSPSFEEIKTNNQLIRSLNKHDKDRIDSNDTNFVVFTLVDMDNKEVMKVGFTPITKILTWHSGNSENKYNKGISNYVYLNAISDFYVGKTVIFYDTFKKVFRTDWDWNVNTKINTFRKLIGI